MSSLLLCFVLLAAALYSLLDFCRKQQMIFEIKLKIKRV